MSSPTVFLTCGLPPSRLGIRNKFLLPSTWRRFISRCSIQNDRVEIVSKELCATFSSKGISCNANDVRTDRLYLTYCLFGRTSARQQMMSFHGKQAKHYDPFFFRQKRYYTTRRQSETMGCTDCTAHWRATRSGSRMLLFTKKTRKRKKERDYNLALPCWATWIRTKNDRTRICSVTITP